MCPATAPTRRGCFLGCFPTLSQGRIARRGAPLAHQKVYTQRQYEDPPTDSLSLIGPRIWLARFLPRQVFRSLFVTATPVDFSWGERAGRIALSGIEFVRRARRSVPANGPRMNASDHVRTSGLTTTLENQVLVTLLRQNYPCHSRCDTCSPDSNRRRPAMVTKDP